MFTLQKLTGNAAANLMFSADFYSDLAARAGPIAAMWVFTRNSKENGTDGRERREPRAISARQHGKRALPGTERTRDCRRIALFSAVIRGQSPQRGTRWRATPDKDDHYIYAIALR